MKKYLILIVFFLTGCANTMDTVAGLGVITERNDTYNNSKIIEVSPTWVTAESDKDFASSKLGAFYNTSSPNKIYLILERDSSVDRSTTYVNYTDISIKIDGVESVYKTSSTNHSSSAYNTVSQTIYTESRAIVEIPMEYLKLMMSGQDVRIRIGHLSTYEDMRFDREMSGYGQKTAKARIQELLDAIKSS